MQRYVVFFLHNSAIRIDDLVQLLASMDSLAPVQRHVSQEKLEETSLRVSFQQWATLWEDEVERFVADAENCAGLRRKKCCDVEDELLWEGCEI